MSKNTYDPFTQSKIMHLIQRVNNALKDPRSQLLADLKAGKYKNDKAFTTDRKYWQKHKHAAFVECFAGCDVFYVDIIVLALRADKVKECISANEENRAVLSVFNVDSTGFTVAALAKSMIVKEGATPRHMHHLFELPRGVLSELLKAVKPLKIVDLK
ncbi:hypothetical protein CW774_004807 [Escherichia coli]|nr:hypothetical protein [Escherichia coli]EFL7968196.1 hypothetical protein [Escherichia coli]EIH2264821.1 hypothetical protein [Escherichia coli]